MKLKYETGVATFIQFIALSVLNIVNQSASAVSSCRADSSQCISDIIVNIIFFILIAVWFGFVCMLGFIAQERRSKLLARLLICAELLISAVALFSIKHHGGALSVFISSLDLVLAFWVITLAFRLSRAGGGRVVSSSRPRQRRRPTPQA